MDAWIDGWMDRSMSGWVARWMDGWMGGWRDGSMDGWMNGGRMVIGKDLGTRDRRAVIVLFVNHPSQL